MRPAIAKSNVVEVIERHQQDAFRQLRHAGVPEAQALLVMQLISSFSLQHCGNWICYTGNLRN